MAWAITEVPLTIDKIGRMWSTGGSKVQCADLPRSYSPFLPHRANFPSLLRLWGGGGKRLPGVGPSDTYASSCEAEETKRKEEVGKDGRSATQALHELSSK